MIRKVLKNYLLVSVFCLLLVGGVFHAGKTLAVGSCDCTASGQKDDCVISGYKSFPYGQVFKISSLREAINWDNCSNFAYRLIAETAFDSYLEEMQAYEQATTGDLCNRIGERGGSVAGATFSFSCVAKGTDDLTGSTGASGVGGGTTVGQSTGGNATGASGVVAGASVGADGVSPSWPSTSGYLNRIDAPDINTFIGRAMKVLVGLLGSIALVMFASAGLTWMVSMDGDKKAKASKTLMWSSLGLIMIMASYAAVSFVFNMIK